MNTKVNRGKYGWIAKETFVLSVIGIYVICLVMTVGASTKGSTSGMSYSFGYFTREQPERYKAESSVHFAEISAEAAEERNVFAGYIHEILLAEGLLQFAVEDLSDTKIDSSLLSSFELILLTQMELAPDEADALEKYVYEGGKLILLRPPVFLSERFGLKSQERTIISGIISMSRDLWVWPSLAERKVQFYGPADTYTYDENANITVAAWIRALSSDAEPRGFPGVVIIKHGQGEVAIFAFDMGKSTVLARQGDLNYASTGEHPDSSGDGFYKPDDLFTQQLETRRLDIPQADIVQRQLINVLYRLVESDVALPRVWYFPRAARAMTLLTGDSDSMTNADLMKATGISKGNSGLFTTYLLEMQTPSELVAQLREQGHSFGVHGWAGGTRPSVEDMRATLMRMCDQFERLYGYTPLTYRGHCLIWVGWSEMASILQDMGVRMDMNFVATYRYGYINGSGLPMRFVDEQGRFIDVYQQSTQFEDDCVLFGYYGFKGLTVEKAIAESYRFMDNAVEQYHGVINFNFHPIYVGSRGDTARWVDAVSSYAKEMEMPMPSGDDWVRFNDARRSILIKDMCMLGSQLGFSVIFHEKINGATLVFPRSWKGLEVARVCVDNTDVEYGTISIYGGVEVATICLDADVSDVVRIYVTYQSMK